MRLYTIHTPLVSLFLVVTAATTRICTSQVRGPVLHDVVQFPNTTWVENLAVRKNGNLLVTLLSAPELFQVDPASKGQQPQLVHQFANITALSGIAEVEKGVFAVAGGNISLATLASVKGSWSVFKVDMRSAKSPSSAKVTKIADIPEAQLLNGMIPLDQSGNVLISDSGAGVIWRVNTRSGDSKIVVDDPLMKPVAGAPAAIGVNGIKIRKGTLFFTNTFGMTFNSVPIQKDGTAIGAAKTIVKNGVGDDFTFDKTGNAFVAQNPLNTLQKITPGGKQVTVVAGNLNSTQLAGPTAAQFGRTKRDGKTLYVTTNGGLAGPINGTIIEGGKVVAVDYIP